MKFKPKKSSKILSDKIADALTVKARPDIEDDAVFGTKPKISSRGDFTSSESEDDAVISDFRRRNVNLLSELSKKYEGEVVSRKKSENIEDVDSDSDDESNNITLNRSLESTSKQNYNDSDATDSSENKESAEKGDGQNVSDSEAFSSDEGESDDYSITKFQKSDSKSHEELDDEEESEDEGEGVDVSALDEPVQEDFNHMTKQNVSEEAKKGASVRNQQLLWENLLEMRIHLQRCMNTANQMPLPDTYTQLNQNTEFANAAVTTKNDVMDVLEKLVSLQNVLLKKNPETKSLATKSEQNKDSKQNQETDADDEEIPSDTDNEEIPSDTEEDEPAPEKDEPKPKTKTSTKKRKFEDLEKELSSSHKAFKSFRDSTIQKWHEKTRLATAANIKNTPTNTVLQQISYILCDQEKLLKRTQLKRTEYDIIGYKKDAPNIENGQSSEIDDRRKMDEYIPEIFDDSDFYHQLLRELIECKSADISDPVQLSRQWIALQQMRSKMKRKVDTKATKGRKIKYVVHNQLINFMAPEKVSQWTEESASELYSSLFGKMFESNNVGLDGVFSDTMKIY